MTSTTLAALAIVGPWLTLCALAVLAAIGRVQVSITTGAPRAPISSSAHVRSASPATPTIGDWSYPADTEEMPDAR